MIPLAGLFRGGFLIVILLWYSVNVWRAMDGYFRDEFKKYLENEYKQNKHLKATDSVGKTDSSEAESVRYIHGTTTKEVGKTAPSFTKTVHVDMIEDNHIQIKQDNIKDIPTPTTPESDKTPFMGTNIKTHISTVHHIQTESKKTKNIV
jgi:hypothetical protein